MSKKHPVKSTQSSARTTAPATAPATATPARPGDLEARTRPAAETTQATQASSAGNGNSNGHGNGTGHGRDASEAGNTSSGASPDNSPDNSSGARAQMIAEAAYYLSEQRGFAPGHEVEDWLEAEQQIDSRIEGARGVLGPMQIS